MGGSIIADNWSLQTVAELLKHGLSEDNTAAVEFDSARERHTFSPLPEAAIAVEALFDLITDLVLRDQLLVDEKFTDTWQSIAGELQQLGKLDLVRPINFLAHPKSIDGLREEFVDRLCVTDSIRESHKKNFDQWNKTQETIDPLLSATLWGGAGMLARAYAYEKGYTPHPLRRRLFQQANVVLQNPDTTAQLSSCIEEKRASYNKAKFGHDALFSLNLSLPPIPLLVIREASDASQLISIALELRDEYQSLRDQLGVYQQAITSGDVTKQESFEGLLRSISTYVDVKAGAVDPKAPTFTVTLGILKAAFRANPVEYLRNQFGVRANANRLILAGSGSEELNRLFGFFGHRHSSVGPKPVEHFSSKQ